MRKVAIGIAAAIALAAVVPANAQGLWIGVPGFGIGIGTGPTYGYGGPYYNDGYYGPNYAAGGYAYEPGYEYGSYGYVPDSGYAAYSYEPGVTYRYATDDYRYGPRAGYPRSYAYSSNARTTREHSDATTRSGIRSDRAHRAAVHTTELRDRAGTRNRSAVHSERESVTPGRSAVGTDRESATSRRVRSEQGTRAMAREPDSRQSKSLKTKKTGTSRTPY
jgi:hypothetical protein